MEVASQIVSSVGSAILAAGTKLGPYQVEALLGAGGMGEVYRAHDPRLGRDIAINILNEKLPSRPAAAPVSSAKRGRPAP